MIKNSSKQVGSAHLIIITIIVLAILGALGFVFWNNFAKKSPTNTSNESTKTDKPTQDTQPAAKKLKLDDWSVAFTVPTDLSVKDVYYYKAHVGEGPDYYGFTTNRVRAEGGYCDNQVTGNLLTLTRNSSKTGEGTLINTEPIGGYYFYADSTNGGITPMPECLTTDAANSDRALLDQMIKTISTE
jgi:hypothetical protein